MNKKIPLRLCVGCKEMKPKKELKDNLAQAANPTLKQKKKILSDVQGSYTGVPMDDEQPVQDADDL